jgi:hypothetical protein
VTHFVNTVMSFALYICHSLVMTLPSFSLPDDGGVGLNVKNVTNVSTYVLGLGCRLLKCLLIHAFPSQRESF